VNSEPCPKDLATSSCGCLDGRYGTDRAVDAASSRSPNRESTVAERSSQLRPVSAWMTSRSTGCRVVQVATSQAKDFVRARWLQVVSKIDHEARGCSAWRPRSLRRTNEDTEAEYCCATRAAVILQSARGTSGRVVIASVRHRGLRSWACVGAGVIFMNLLGQGRFGPNGES